MIHTRRKRACTTFVVWLTPLVIAGCAGSEAPQGEETASLTHAYKRVVELPRSLGGETVETELPSDETPTEMHALGLAPLDEAEASFASEGVFEANPSAAVPEKVDLSAHAPVAGNQGKLGSCAAWATAYTATGWWLNKLGKTEEPNPLFVYSLVKDQSKTQCGTGSAVAMNLEFLRTVGVAPSTEYKAATCTMPTGAQRAAAATQKIKGFRKVELAADRKAALMAALAEGKPVIVSIATANEFRNVKPSAFLVGRPSSSVVKEGLHGLHAITALGYDAKGLWILNSWGTGWGKAGWAQLSWEYVTSPFTYVTKTGQTVMREAGHVYQAYQITDMVEAGQWSGPLPEQGPGL